MLALIIPYELLSRAVGTPPFTEEDSWPLRCAALGTAAERPQALASHRIMQDSRCLAHMQLGEHGSHDLQALCRGPRAGAPKRQG